MKILTVAVRENDSFPYESYLDPMLYTVSVEDPDDDDAILNQIAATRLEEIGDDDDELEVFKNGLDLLFAFEGDLDVYRDWRE